MNLIRILESEIDCAEGEAEKDVSFVYISSLPLINSVSFFHFLFSYLIIWTILRACMVVVYICLKIFNV